jgi:hypothetical protein
VFRCYAKTIAQKKRAVDTRPFGRELGLYLKKAQIALTTKDLSSYRQRWG